MALQDPVANRTSLSNGVNWVFEVSLREDTLVAQESQMKKTMEYLGQVTVKPHYIQKAGNAHTVILDSKLQDKRSSNKSITVTNDMFYLQERHCKKT